MNTKRKTMDIPGKIFSALEKEARKQHRSVNAEIVYLLEKGLKLEKEEGAVT